MRIWSWLNRRGQKRTTEAVDSIAPVFEQLEPRLLLSADALGLEIGPATTDPLEAVIPVDLDYPDSTQLQQAGTDLTVSIVDCIATICIPDAEWNGS